MLEPATALNELPQPASAAAARPETAIARAELESFVDTREQGRGSLHRAGAPGATAVIQVRSTSKSSNA
jgi:hypothetical protein